MMKEIYIKLLTSMETLVTLHRELLPLEQQKVDLIIDQNWEDLQRLVHKSKKILKGIEASEASRVKLIELIGCSKNSSLLQIAERLPEEIGEDLLKCGENLRSLLLQLKNLESRCEQLIGSSLEVIDFTLSMMSGAVRGRTYKPDGEEKKGEGGHTALVFDLKA
jgi:flagellar biosynthesis/type III secretory pathway chaperone